RRPMPGRSSSFSRTNPPERDGLEAQARGRSSRGRGDPHRSADSDLTVGHRKERQVGRRRAGSRVSDEGEADLVGWVVGGLAVVLYAGDARQARQVGAVEVSGTDDAAHPGLVALDEQTVDLHVDAALTLSKLISPLARHAAVPVLNGH